MNGLYKFTIYLLVDTRLIGFFKKRCGQIKYSQQPAGPNEALEMAKCQVMAHHIFNHVIQVSGSAVPPATAGLGSSLLGP